jgi:hypothetical protein
MMLGITSIVKIPPPTSNAPLTIISIDTIVTPIGRDLSIKTATGVYAFSDHKWFLPF